MQLTAEQEQDYIERYSGRLKAIARGFFFRRNGARTVDLDDLIQECNIVFLKRLRDVEKEEDIDPLPYRTFLNAMCMLVLESMPMRVPRSTKNFSEITSRMNDVASVDSLIDSGIDPVCDSADDYADMDTQICLEQFMREISPKDREILMCMVKSVPVRDISTATGLHRTQVWRRLAKMKEKYASEYLGRNNLGGKSA